MPVKCLLDRQNGRHAEKTRSKRCLTSSDSSGSEVTQKRAKRQVKYSTRRELNKEHRCLEWLECDRDEHWCDVCRRYKEKLQGMRNYTGIWVSGSTNHKTSNIADHASSDQHLAVMQRLDMERKRAQGIPQVDYSPIIQCMTRLNEDERKKLKGKFEICYMLARESLAFVKYVPLHALSDHLKALQPILQLTCGGKILLEDLTRKNERSMCHVKVPVTKLTLMNCPSPLKNIPSMIGTNGF